MLFFKNEIKHSKVLFTDSSGLSDCTHMFLTHSLKKGSSLWSHFALLLIVHLVVAPDPLSLGHTKNTRTHTHTLNTHTQRRMFPRENIVKHKGRGKEEEAWTA